MKPIFTFIFLLSSFSAFAGDDKRAITVSGKCDLSVEPDRGAITFTVESLNKNIKKSTSETNKVGTSLIKALKGLKLKNAQVSTESYNVRKETQWENRKNIFKGYKSTMGVRIETSDIKKISKAIDVANDLKVTNIGQLNLFISNELNQKLAIDCLKIATKNAKQKASELLAGLDAKLGQVLEVVEGGGANSAPIPVPVMRFAKRANTMEMSDAAPAIQGKKQKYSKSVVFSFEIQ